MRRPWAVLRTSLPGDVTVLRNLGAGTTLMVSCPFARESQNVITQRAHARDAMAAAGPAREIQALTAATTRRYPFAWVWSDGTGCLK